MKFHEPSTVEEAVALLAADPAARCLAGGATLVQMMNARLAEPSALISLRRILSLKQLTLVPQGSVFIGAMALHRTIAESTLLTGGQTVLREAAKAIGHPAIRNVGTIGGAIGHADSAADYPPALVAAGAVIEIAGPRGRRRLAADAFFLGNRQTILRPGELVTGVEIPKPPPGTAGVYEKFGRLERDVAIASVALILALENEACGYVRLALGACGPVPVRSQAAEARLSGSALDDRTLAEASELLVARCQPIDDVRASAEYRLMLVPELIRRAIARAKAGLEAGT